MQVGSTAAMDEVTEVGAAKGLRAQTRRKALADALKEHDLNPADLAHLAKLPQANCLYNFLNGRAESLSTRTWEKLIPHLPRADIRVLLGLSEPGESAVEVANEKRLRAYMRKRTIEQVVGHITEVRLGLTDLQQMAASCVQQLAVLEARVTDLQEK